MGLCGDVLEFTLSDEAVDELHRQLYDYQEKTTRTKIKRNYPTNRRKSGKGKKRHWTRQKKRLIVQQQQQLRQNKKNEKKEKKIYQNEKKEKKIYQ